MAKKKANPRKKSKKQTSIPGFIARPFTSKQHLVAYLQKLEVQHLWYTDMFGKLVQMMRAVLRQDWIKAYHLAKELEPNIHGTNVGSKSHYSQEYILDMLRRYKYCKENGLSIGQLCRRNGISMRLIYLWKAKVEKGEGLHIVRGSVDIPISLEDLPTPTEVDGYVRRLKARGGSVSRTQHVAAIQPRPFKRETEDRKPPRSAADLTELFSSEETFDDFEEI